MKALLETLLSGATLDREHARQAMRAMLSPEARPEQIAAVLSALRLRGESVEELAGFLEGMREGARPLPLPGNFSDAFDTCGTGGDSQGTFNISTTVAFVLAGGGVRVAKHGNRSASGQCGSADVLEALGARLDRSPSETTRALADCGFVFLYAPLYHPALARLAPVRRALAVRTVFNALGPLANPAGVRRQLVGVSDRKLLPVFAQVLNASGTRSALIVHAEDGLDEVSLNAPTHFTRLHDGRISDGVFTPEDFGLARADLIELRGGDATTNARLLENILRGEDRGPRRRIVEMNAAAGFVAAERCADFAQGLALARQVLDTGLAYSVLEKTRRLP